ncbi:MAG: molybdopterin-dependent oxidoreductase [Deltaproteobacteria bacterium]|nr:molybdopterin-dependent oxidoreductase [Deltaproteobacteria bacterium]
MADRQIVHKTCNICEAMCGLLIEITDNKVVRIKPDPDDVLSHGHICPKAIALREIQEDPDRLKFPVRRTAAGWERISWDEALEEVASQLAGIQARSGDDAVATYMGNPAAHNLGIIMYLTSLNKALSTRNRYSASSLDQNPKHASSLFLYGNTLSIPIPDIDRTDFLLVLGANPMVSNGGLLTAPDFRRRAADLRGRGGRLVIVDPRRTETAQIADEHLFIRPGGDALLLAALLHTIFSEGLMSRSLSSPSIPAEVVEAAVGIPAQQIRDLASAFAAARSAVCYGRFGTCTNPFGTLTSWLIDVINIVTGNLDRPGGAMFPTPAADLPGVLRLRGATGTYDSWRTRVRGAPEFNDEQPTACLAEEILTPGEGQVRGLVTIAGNPALSAPNALRLDEALAQLDFFVAVDFYVNETTRHANVILPPTWSLEHENYEVLFHGFAVRNTSTWSPQVIEPEAGTLHEWQILTELGFRIMEKKAGRLASRAALRVAKRIVPGPKRALDIMLRIGPFGDHFVPWRKGLRVRDLEAAPSGIDLGPLKESLDRVLCTPSLEVDLGHPVMLAEIVRLEGELGLASKPGEEALLLIGRRDIRSNNSWLHNAPLAVKGGERCELIVHPRDAERLRLTPEGEATVTSRTGELTVSVKVSDEIMQGVVSLPHGWGHALPGVLLQVAQRAPGVNCNVLTDDEMIESVVGNAVLNGVPVQVKPVDFPTP